MELNEKQIDLIESIYKSLDKSEYGQMLENWQSEDTVAEENAAEDFYYELQAACGLKIALKYDEIISGLSGSNHRDGFITGFICAMALTGKA